MCRSASKEKKLCAWGWVALSAGVILLVIGISIPALINSELKDEVVKGVAVNKENQEQWDNVPGPYNVSVVDSYILYNWTNPDEVILDGAKP